MWKDSSREAGDGGAQCSSPGGGEGKGGRGRFWGSLNNLCPGSFVSRSWGVGPTGLGRGAVILSEASGPQRPAAHMLWVCTSVWAYMCTWKCVYDTCVSIFLRCYVRSVYLYGVYICLLRVGVRGVRVSVMCICMCVVGVCAVYVWCVCFSGAVCTACIGRGV